MRALAKIGLVAAGYAAAVAVAVVVVALHIAATSGPEAQASSGMYAFGDSVLFLAVFGMAALAPSGAALYFLRPFPSFWRALRVAALVVAATCLAAGGLYFAARAAGEGSLVESWAPVAVLRILCAPLLALAFALSALFAPARSARIPLFGAALTEAGVFAAVALTWFLSWSD